ncbi:DUF3180 domain-containing protein [Xylanimonas oleitrophica]|uniref:DUF3180 domain-containing protein n=1 Tax=Xylanimonas oleitrophica TaxID=2607479 RepID=A0A2W5WK16_9MICO|nr:DUF3180 domain-containing protein [Xylanimonas oleitrophica]PZR51597.1 DUF3180 domain-containing protein [Xylanimonas oleitrophica]
MRRTSVRTLVPVALGVTVVGTVVMRALRAQGVHLPPVPWVEHVALLGLAAVIFWMGWAVRAYQRGDRPDLDPLRAARTFVLAKAAALTGAILLGRYLASVLDVVGDLEVASQRERAVAAGVAALCAVVLSVVGLVVEKFCEIPPPDDDAQGGGGNGGGNGSRDPEPLAS